MNKIFRTQRTLTFREADPAGIMFFGHILGLAHDAFEQFLSAAGYQYAEWFEQRDVLIPIRHTQCDFLAPFRPGQTYDILVSVESFGTSSFKMKYIFSQNQNQHALVSMVHTVVDGTSMKKISLPTLMKSRLQPYLESESV